MMERDYKTEKVRRTKFLEMSANFLFLFFSCYMSHK